MAIFGTLELEAKVQENDKTRLDARKSFISTGEAAITLVRIDPGDGSGFVDVTSDQYLDWSYSLGASQAVTVTVEITTDGAPETFTKDIEFLTESDDKLFSTDAELVPYEPDLLNYVRQGRNSFKDIHRMSQERILEFLDEKGYWDSSDDPLTKDAIIDTEEVNAWSRYMTLRLIFEGLSNATDDIFHIKALRYRELENESKDRMALRVDLDGDAAADDDIALNMKTINIVRV